MKAVAVAAVLLAGLLAGCVSSDVDDVAVPIPEPVTALEPALEVNMTSTTNCFIFHNIPFTDKGWPDRYLPAGYTSADASTVWGLPVNFQFSAAGLGVQGCYGDAETDADDWWYGVLHIMVEPPNLEGMQAVRPTSTPSPFTARDGGFNMYILEWYADGAVYELMAERGWNVKQMALEIDLPDFVEATSPANEDRIYAANPSRIAALTLTDDEGVFTTNTIDPDVFWNHRNFEFMFFHEHDDGTGASPLASNADHLVVGPGTCEIRDDTLAAEIIGTMPYLGDARQRSRGECPDDGLGALWIYNDLADARLLHLPGVFAA